jgi:hypothetical protein
VEMNALKTRDCSKRGHDSRRDLLILAAPTGQRFRNVANREFLPRHVPADPYVAPARSGGLATRRSSDVADDFRGARPKDKFTIHLTKGPRRSARCKFFCVRVESERHERKIDVAFPRSDTVLSARVEPRGRSAEWISNDRKLSHGEVC